MSTGEARTRLKAARARLHEQRQTREAIRLERLLESSSAGISGPTPFDFINAYSIILDRFRSEPWAYSVTNAYDKKFGRNFPIYQSEPELSLLRAPARVLVQTNTYAQALVGGLKSYIIGPGYTYRAAARDKVPNVPQGLPEAVQEVIDRFLRLNQWNASDPWQLLEELPLRPIEGEAFERSLRDGECGILHYADPDSGETDARFFEPDYLSQPPGSSWEEYSFGIKTPRNDEQKKLAFWISFTGNVSDGEEYPVRDISWLTRNSDRISKRGVPDFSFDALHALQTAQRLRSALAVGGAQKAAVVGVRQHKGQTLTQTTAFKDNLADRTQVNLVTGAIDSVRQYTEGGWEDIPENLEYVDGPSTSKEAPLVEVLNACLRGAVVRWNGFEWLVSADASSNSYANALQAQAPAVQRVRSEQDTMYKPFFMRSMGIAVRNACDAGRIRVNGYTFSFEEVRRYVEIQIEAPNPEVQDKAQETQSALAEIQAGQLSPQTYAQERGRDYEREQKNIEQHQQRFPPQPPPGMPPGAAPPPGGPQPPPPPPPPGGEEGGAATLPFGPSGEPSPALESLLMEGGFTGTDAHGHHWVSGKQVKASPEQPAADTAVALPDEATLTAKAHSRAARILKAVAALPGKAVPARVKAVVAKVKTAMMKRLVGRYGERGASLILKVAAISAPIPLPGSQPAAIALSLVIAEGIRFFRKPAAATVAESLLREATVKNRSGPGCHDTQTGRPSKCSTATTTAKDPSGREHTIQTAAQVHDMAASAYAEPTPEKVAELAHHLSHLTVAEIHDIKKRLGLKASGRKADLIAKVSKLAAMRLTLAERYGRQAVALGHKPRDLEMLAGRAREVNNDTTDLINKVQTEARRLYASKFPGKVLGRSMAAFKDGDYTEIRDFDNIARTLAGRYPEVLGDGGYHSDRVADASETAAAERLFEILSAGKIERMTIEDSYEAALGELRTMEPEPRAVRQKRQPHPGALTPGEEVPF